MSEGIYTGAVIHRYVSTYCQHAQCDQCRQTCKVCEARCLCPCHQPERGSQ